MRLEEEAEREKKYRSKKPNLRTRRTLSNGDDDVDTDFHDLDGAMIKQKKTKMTRN